MIIEEFIMSKVAVVQYAPVFFDRESTIKKAIMLVKEAAENGAQLVVFPEAFISAYPAWIWRLRPGNDWTSCEALHQKLFNSAVDLSEGHLQKLQQVAKKYAITLVCGFNERDSQLSRFTLYNSVVTIGQDGQILNHHRKLMPTNPERMVWGFGDGSGLNVVPTPVGRISTLICWENYMPLTRYSLFAQGVEVYIAPTYDSGDAWIGTMQHISREARCWVISSGVVLTAKDIPDDFPDKDNIYSDPDEWINNGIRLLLHLVVK